MPHLKVGLLMYPGCMPTGLFAAADLFRAANLRSGRRVLDWQWVSLREGPVACAHSVSLPAEAGLGKSAYDAVLIPGIWADSPAEVQSWLERHQEVVQAVRALPPKVQVWSYCTGVAVAAGAGRLNQETATATWWLASSLQERHPEVRWRWEHNCIVNKRTATATGVHGYLPIVCDRVERLLSADRWRDVARLMVLPRPQRAASVFQSLALMETPDPWLRRLRLVIEACPASEASVDRLAAEMAVSPRSLARKVMAATNTPVASYARLVKLNQVGEQLSHTNLPLVAIGDALGFADESSLRRMFKQVTGMTPVEFRNLYPT